MNEVNDIIDRISVAVIDAKRAVQKIDKQQIESMISLFVDVDTGKYEKVKGKFDIFTENYSHETGARFFVYRVNGEIMVYVSEVK